MNLRDIAKKVGSYINSKTQDDQGWFQQGNFTVPKPVKNFGMNVLNEFNRQQESLHGNTSGSYSNQLKTSLPGQAATKVNTLFSNFSTPEKQQTFNEQPVTDFGQGVKSYFKNRYVAPIAQVPYRAKQLISGKSAGEKIQGGLGLLGGTVAMVPDLFGDILYPGYEYLKGVTAAQKRGEGTLQSYKTGLSDLRGQTSTGAGTAFGQNETQETLGNILELPVMLMVSGKVSKNKIKADEILKLSDDIAKYSILAKNYSKLNPDIQMNVIGKITEYSKKIIPDVINNKEMKELSMRDPSAWLKYLSNFLDDAVMNARHPELNFGFNTRTLKKPELKQRGFSASVQEAPDITKKTKIKVLGGYETKSNDVLMGEAKALLTQGGTIKDVKNVQNIDQKITAAMQEAINLDAQGQHEAAANLFNNLSDIGTELGRGVQSYSLLQKMSPQAIALSAAGKIKKYNQTAKVKIPELTGQQQKVISDQVNSIINLPDGREKNIALNQLENTINSFIPSSKTDKFLTVWKAGLLTSIRTHARNIVGNTIMQGSEMMSNVPGSFADRLMALRTGQRTLTPSVQGTLQGTKEGFSQAGDIMKYGFDPTETIQKFDIKKVNWGNTPTQKAMKAYTDFVFNSLSAEDKPFYQSSYVRSLYNQASAAAINAGKSGDAKYIKNLVDNATEQMKTIATNDANYATFKDKNALSKLASAFKQSTNGKWYTKLPAEIVAPFTQVPSSMVQKTFDYSPIGLIKGIKDAGKVITQNVPDLQRQAAQEIGRGTIGTGIFALGSYLMAKGLMTGQPKDDAERKQWELEGKQQNSILINGKWRSINSVGPQTLILLAGAKYDEEMNDPEGSMAQYGIGLVQDQLNQTFLSGVQQPLQAITDPQRYGKSYVGGQVASFVPNIVKDTAKAFDPVARETDTGSMMGNIKTSVQSGIPGWRNQMTPKRDTLGNILKQEPTGLGAYVDLFNSKTPISNTVVDELSRLNNAGFNATPSKLGTSQTISGIKVKLDQKSLDKYEETAGKAVSSALESLFASNSYQKLDDQSKQEAIDDVVSKERKKVRANMNLSWTPDMGYTKSTDSPTGISRVGLYGKSVITDPKQTIKAVLDGNPIRKVEGGTVILERKNSLGSLDQGNKATEVDHKIALTLGGTNKEDNLQVLTKEENRIKGAFETYLYKEMKAGRITKEEAQKRDLNWREEVGKIPQSEQTKIVEGLESEAVDTSSGKVYKLVGESGTVTTIDLSKAIEEPKLTGFTEVDKKLKSSYKSAITTRINNIVKLYEDGQLSAEEAEKYIKELKAKSTGTGSTKSKGGKITIKAPKYDIPKISVKFQETPSTIKLKSAPKIKVSSSNQRRYTIKA